jgi:exosortase family protein XrtM
MIRKWAIYFTLFLAIFGTLVFGYYQAQGTIVSRLVVDDFTVRPAAALINVIFPAAAAKAQGRSLSTRFGQLNILDGCEGAEAMFLLVAAVLPYPAPWRFRLVGLCCGVLLIYILNLTRVVVLLASLHWRPHWFGSIHAIIAPTAIVLFGGLFFLLWANGATVHERV